MKMSNIVIATLSFLSLGLTFSRIDAQQWTPDPFCPYPSDHVTRYPYYGNCSIYWECYEGTKYVMPCPDGLEFNAPLQECDTPEIANCDPLASTTKNPNPPTYTTISTPSHQPGPNCPTGSSNITYYPYDGNCSLYWECWKGDSYLYACPPGLWWHEEISECDYAGDFCNNGSTGSSNTTPSMSTSTDSSTHSSTSTSTDSSTYSSTSSSSTTPGSNLPECKNVGDTPIFYPYPGDCTKFYECADGELFFNNCPPDLWWHEDIEECDYPGPYCNN